MALNQGAGIAGIGFLMKHTRGMGVEDGVIQHLLIGGQTNDGTCGVSAPSLEANEGLVSGGCVATGGRHLIRVCRRSHRTGAIDVGRVDGVPTLRRGFGQQRRAPDLV